MSQITDTQCRDKLFHDYSDIVGDDDDLTVERCIRCGHKIRFIKDNRGKIDNKKYLKAHRFELMQPGDKEWDRYYGGNITDGHNIKLKGNVR